jgi:outer membrane protein
MKLKIFVLTLLTFQIAILTAQQTWTLDTCINYALKNNLNIIKQDLTVDLLRNNYDISRYNRLPSVNGNISAGESFGKTFSQDKLGFVDERIGYVNADISANVALFDGFRNKKRIEISLREQEAATHDKERYANDIALQIVNYYLQILYNGEQAKAAQNQLQTTQIQIERTEELMKAGSVPKGDVLELKAQSAGEKAQIIRYKNLEKEARINLRQMMDLRTDTIIIAKPETIEAKGLYAKLPPISDIYNIAIQHLPEIKAIKARMEASNTAIDLAKADYYPSLYLGGSVSTRYNEAAVNFEDPTGKYKFGEQAQDFVQANVGLTLSIPIFNKYRTKYNVDNALIDYEITKVEESITLQNIYKKIESARNDARASYGNFKAAEIELAASEEAFSYAEERFNAGVINSTEYNLAKNTLAQSNINLLNAKFELIFKVKILDFYMGNSFSL